MTTEASAANDDSQPNFDFMDESEPDAKDLQISTLEDVQALIAKKHNGRSVGSDDPIWLLHTMFGVLVEDLLNLLEDTNSQQGEEREKLKALLPEVAKTLSESLQSELSGLSSTLGQLRQDAEASSVENLLKQQAQFSSELGTLTSKVRGLKWPFVLLTALNWFAVGAFYLIMIK
ncbi:MULTISPECIES: hypothetical protein [unclassified Pseudovibrio]|uniref:hypothetical protein n=1 Tax=unclassified Pseudovibrio TaxID=2627060 RepID=UPI0007AECAAE|nr:MULTISPECIES: hypothetical protein [unclassified Pseudovibrio]KZK96893.1 hypothetical protein PsW74_03845 [Pseudovibrio sp. W74]KZL05211.1 hypothetical protein PsAD14_04827 [Pseudovibrio sp. Ad14]